MTGSLSIPQAADRFADLHLHTQFSDGTYTPDELVAQAKLHGLAALALTDHDTLEGCGATAEACRRAGIEFIVGSELTAEYEQNELHILGYYLDPANPKLQTAMQEFQAVRQQRIQEMVSRLNALGVDLRAETVMALANCKSPGRPHVARALVELGVCATVDEAFERFLKRHRPGWAPKFKISAADAIALIHGAGGVAIMAHPGLNRMDEAIPALVALGLDGIECFHTKHTPAAAERYSALARRLGVLITGGSDCHGYTKGKPLMGMVKLPYSYVAALAAKAGRSSA